MTSNLLLSASLALSALVPASAAAATADHPHKTVRAPAPARHVVHPSPLVSLTPSSIRLRAERTGTGVALSLA